ncbi:MAG: type IV secretory system conjugative DNA transfer family protein [Patescibacteria group bacterium]
MDPNSITYFGETDARNKKVKFGIRAKDRLKHMYIIGKTGMGKSTLLENMAIQDIQNGNGMAFIDPHGGTADKLLEYVPEHRIKDVLYFAPFDMEYPISFNVMEDIGPDKRHLVVNGLMSTFEKIWVDAWSARMAYILQNTLLALLEYPGATLLGVNRMLSDKEYRKKVVDNITDTSVKAFWVDEFGKWTEKFIAEAIPAIQNKVGQFTANPLVRNLLGQSKSTFDVRQMMDEKKILIVNLSKGRVGEGNASLLGAMLITKIYLAAMSRADKNKAEIEKLPNFYLYVDEFQSFANKSFADILSEARKYNLNLTIAHQYIEQMEEEVRNAVFGNVGTMISFRVGAFDAEVLEKEFSPAFMATDLVNLGFTQIYLKLMIDGVSSHPFSATTMGPIAKDKIDFKDAVIQASRDQFGRPRALVEKDITDWFGESNNSNRPTNGGQKEGEGYNNKPREQFGNNSRPDTRQAPRQDSRPEPRIEQRPEQRQERRPEPRPEVRDEQRPKENVEVKKVFKDASTQLFNGNNRPAPVGQPRDFKPFDTHTIKKNPSKENLSSLKDALASVVAGAKKAAPEYVPKIEPRTQEKVEPKPRTEEPIAKKPETTTINTKKEVPESVLRDLLQ